MTLDQRLSKRERVVSDILDRIRNQTLRSGDQLPGEHELARQLNVSRGTVRSALAELNEREVIHTQSGIGSFVSFDGVQLQQNTGWAVALSDAPGGVETELLRIVETEPTAEAVRRGARTIILVERRRRADDGSVISLERSFLPAVGAIALAPRSGLTDGSITHALAAEGLREVSYHQTIGAAPLGPRDAELMETTQGRVMLTSTRVSLSESGGFVEQVDSFLDPNRFRIEVGGVTS